MNEFVELLKEPQRPLCVSFETPSDMLLRGLNFFLGDKAEWVQGYDDISDWLADNKSLGLLLYGANGRGKSLMIRQILPTLFRYYYRADKIFVCRGINLSQLKPNTADYYDMLASRIVSIDDFGTEDMTSNYGVRYDAFSDLVDFAEIDKKLLLLSTNLSPKEIEQRYGLRTIDRLKALTRPICFTGESLRWSNKKKHNDNV